MNTTQERLAAYGNFSTAVVDRVCEVTEQQQSMTYEEFLAEYNVPDKPETVCFDGQKPIQVLDFIPAKGTDCDEKEARVARLAIEGSVDDLNQVYQMASIFAFDPTTRLIAIGGPGALGHGAGKVSRSDAGEVWNGKLKPIVEPSLRYLARERIERVKNFGFSSGASTTLVASAEADDHEVIETRVIEPVDNVFRGPKWVAVASLAIDLAKTFGPLEGYVEASGVPAFIEARDESPIMPSMALGLLRLTNLAMAGALAGDFFDKRARNALGNQPDSRLVAIWGTDSELAWDSNMIKTMSALMREPGFKDRVFSLRMEKGKHNMVNDLALQVAAVHQPVVCAA